MKLLRSKCFGLTGVVILKSVGEDVGRVRKEIAGRDVACYRDGIYA